MANAASTSYPSCIVDVGEAFPYRSHVIGLNIVTVKLSGKNEYNLWRLQMECLLKSQHMVGFIEGEFPSPAGNGKGKVGDMEAWIAGDSLVKGCILGSLSKEAAMKAVNHLTHIQKKTDFTAKDLWDELRRSYGPSVREQATETELTTRQAESEYEDAKSEIEVITVSESELEIEVITESESEYEDAKSEIEVITVSESESEIEVITVSEDASSYGPSVREQAAETKLTIRQAESVTEVNPVSEDAKSEAESIGVKIAKEYIYIYIIRGEINWVIDQLEKNGLNPWDKLTNNGNTTLHVAVGSSTKNHELLKKLLEMTPPEKTLLDVVNSDGSSLLHVAAIGGNTEVVDILVERNPELLLAKDKEGHTPLAISVSNMHIKTSQCLFEHMKQKGYGSYFSGQSGEDIVVLAISCQDFRLANMLIESFPDAILSDSDAVLTALAQNFPPELNSWERRRRGYYSWERRRRGYSDELDRTLRPYNATHDRLEEYFEWPCGHQLFITCWIFFVGLCAMKTVFYEFLNVLVRLFFEDTFHIHEVARLLLFNICHMIYFSRKSSTHLYCTTSIFEATRRNASTFIRVVMKEFPNAIWSTNEDGHNFIQYSVINRSEKIYNLLYEMSDHKNIYKTIKDSSGNNLLHLAARLAPTNKLNLISGAALQIQRELQWFKEVERFVCPLNRIQKNSDDETPEMVFTREHKDLVIEGENWIKKTAESYTITAALIITIVFAAGITVPGGNNQESGIPIFTNNIAFKVFAISNAISLFTAVTSLLLFLSILTARFAEQDFLFKLPRKLIIGLTMLFLSTTAMVIAFGATSFLVFGQRNLLMLIPIGAMTCLPITSFVTLQFPLIMELTSATYCGGIFVKDEYEYGYFY